jgi:tetratricopeptide (TPR) repeat protein
VFALYSARRMPEALAEIHRLLQKFPAAPLLLNIEGTIHAGLGHYDEAVTSYRRALALRPDVADTHFHLGNALAARGDRSEALAAFERAVAIRPEYVEAHGQVCRELERANRVAELREALERADRHCSPNHPVLQLRRAELARHEADFEAARRALETPPSAPADSDTAAARDYLLAEVLDRQGDAAGAFEAATRANRQSASTELAQRISRDAYRDQIAMLQRRFTAEWVASWEPATINDSHPDPVFLVGFPRSGTTLLDTLLRSHPGIAVVEEQPMVRMLEQAVAALPGGYPDALQAGDLDALRAAYFAELARHLGPQQSTALVVDKLPLNLVHAGLLQRVFPRSRFLFALRHPCDSVLSCYLRSFELNEGMVNFLTLEDAAELYDAVMTLWQSYRQVLPLSVYTLRYEDVVASVRTALVPLLDFLDLDWHPDLEAHVDTARARVDIQTPSYHQVIEPIYTRARDRWERYREPLSPVLPTLEPWVAEWGY